MCLNHPATILPTSIIGKIVFPKTNPWCQKGWEPLSCDLPSAENSHKALVTGFYSVFQVSESSYSFHVLIIMILISLVLCISNSFSRTNHNLPLNYFPHSLLKL